MVRVAAWRDVARRLAPPALALGLVALLLVWLASSVWLDFIPSPLFAGLRHWAVPARLLAAGSPPAASDLPAPPAWGLLALVVLGIASASKPHPSTQFAQTSYGLASPAQAATASAASSTAGWNHPIGCPHRRQRPRKAA